KSPLIIELSLRGGRQPDKAIFSRVAHFAHCLGDCHALAGLAMTRGNLLLCFCALRKNITTTKNYFQFSNYNL
ncbi:hypothetical protein, partial [Flexilinea flocculi]|uniref:hypothetical protein n=1 Tax=Flexilinea flocculi TaxID=1678840 RepID=UPI001F324A07